ncbi:MAG: aminoglycoside phosphotransferase family protein [Oscillospiraceae bacterium]|nr:aminoglycoside phosphotransferase family protein [Oscillospiraceae bacterium]
MRIPSAAYAFQIVGKPVSCQEFGQGHINHTLKLKTDAGRFYILQRINQYVFRQPIKVMENACAITEFLRTKDHDPRHSLRFIHAKDGNCYFIDENSQFWRMYEFVEGLSLDAPETEKDFYQSALAFGHFQMLLSDFPAASLHETIPEFHNTVDRYRLLRQSIAADPCNRAKDVAAEIAFLTKYEDLACTLQRMLEAGQLPLRVTHNDTKLNNVLLDRNTHEYLCILDLDTVMPGLSLYDYGDSIRFGAATTASEEAQHNSLDLHLFEVYTKGFLEAATNLTDTEVQMLPIGAVAITIELATRFLKDYLDGDLYFKTAYPGHNLDRTRGQIALAADMITKLDEMKRIVTTIRTNMAVCL